METKRNYTKSEETNGLFPKSTPAACLPPSLSSYTVSARALTF